MAWLSGRRRALLTLTWGRGGRPLLALGWGSRGPLLAALALGRGRGPLLALGGCPSRNAPGRRRRHIRVGRNVG
jgi:hypothetical protein